MLVAVHSAELLEVWVFGDFQSPRLSPGEQPIQRVEGSHLEGLIYWVTERESLRRQRAAGLPPPWTDDPILAGNRFTNVRRMDDRVSRWLAKWWYPENIASRAPGKVLALAGMARLVNWPDSLRGLAGKLSTARQAREHLQARADSGEKTFTAAYKVSPGGESSKIAFVVGQAAQLSRSPALLRPDSMAATWQGLQTVPGIGPFMAGQIVADLRYVYPGAWADRDTFAPMGPGSRRGIGWLRGWDGKGEPPALQQAEFLRLIRLLMAELKQHDDFMAVLEDRRLEMMDLQSCLCEFDKMMRVRTGTGKAKTRYIARQQTKRPARGGPMGEARA